MIINMIKISEESVQTTRWFKKTICGEEQWLYSEFKTVFFINVIGSLIFASEMNVKINQC